MTEQVIILEPGEERAQHIARALSSRTAGKVLDILSDGPRQLSFISDQLDIPLPQVKYHVDNLLDAGILEVIDERYSVKGRRVKIYGLKHQVLVVAPKMVNLKALLLKYSSVCGLFLLAALAFSLFHDKIFSTETPLLLGGGSIGPAPQPTVMSILLDHIPTDPLTILLFCAGGGVAVGASLILELYFLRKGER
ncbi:MAG TPA: helix-turn-helix transcriptional regulator [Methanolinea sp.]|nr:MAG: Helix-turn-helix domain protein [Methanoregulaceae archaeon PtaB.Bin009]HII76406.1 helix-turn-helix transcriptional regulator [Methanolinea sp.]HNQ29589.1 helix-turn-helix domain-containing protein [Methanolinea sp.]